MSPGFADDPHAAEDLHTWQVLRPLLDAGPYLPWSTGSMRPSAMVAVCNEIVHGRRRTVVECGSGVSTVVVARLLRQLGAPASVTSLEHDADWAELVTELLHREGLDHIGSVRHAPLEGDPPWYAGSAVDRLPTGIDLLVVDGPPAFAPGEGLRRAPAMSRLEERMTPDATVYLDDAQRPGEQAVVRDWNLTTSWRFVTDDLTAVAVGHRDRSPAR